MCPAGAQVIAPGLQNAVAARLIKRVRQNVMEEKVVINCANSLMTKRKIRKVVLCLERIVRKSESSF